MAWGEEYSVAGWSLGEAARTLAGRSGSKPVFKVVDNRGRPPRLGDVSLADLGVHEPHGDYISREADAALTKLLADGAPLIVVHGPRLAGSTRTLAEAARNHLADHILYAFHPDPRIGVADLVRQARKARKAVLWLDAAGTAQLSQLTEPVPTGVRILVTTDSALLGGARLPDEIAGVSVAVGPLTVAELDALRSEYGDLPEDARLGPIGRLVIPFGDVRTALGGASDERSIRMDRRALLHVLADWQRLDPSLPLTGKTLATLYVDYRREVANLDPKAAVSQPGRAQAMEWAAGRGLITEVFGAGGEHYYGDRLLSAVADIGGALPVSGPFWRYAARAVGSQTQRAIGLTAFDRGDYAHARELLDHLPVTELPARVPYAIADKAHRVGSLAIARHWYAKAIAADDPDLAPKSMVDLAVLEATQRRPDEARRWFNAAIETKHPDEAPRAMRGLGVLAKGQGNADEARQWFSDAIHSHHPAQAANAMIDLGVLAEEQGAVDEARSWYEKAADADQADATAAAVENLAALGPAEESAAGPTATG